MKGRYIWLFGAEKYFSGQIHRIQSHFIIPIFVFERAVSIWKLDRFHKNTKSSKIGVLPTPTWQPGCRTAGWPSFLGHYSRGGPHSNRSFKPRPVRSYTETMSGCLEICLPVTSNQTTDYPTYWRGCATTNVLEDRTKGSENPGSKSFLRILIGIGTALRIGGKDRDSLAPNASPIRSLYQVFICTCRVQR